MPTAIPVDVLSNAAPIATPNATQNAIQLPIVIFIYLLVIILTPIVYSPSRFHLSGHQTVGLVTKKRRTNVRPFISLNASFSDDGRGNARARVKVPPRWRGAAQQF